MLLDFQFSNFRSFYDEQVLSFEATSLKGRSECIFPSNDPNIKKALPVSIVMGSNASGKSNLLRALSYMKKQVLSSYSKADTTSAESSTGRDAFSLNEQAKIAPSKFEISFVQDQIPYKYGFSCDDRKIIDEWLFAYPHGQKQKWYIRNNDSYDFGKKLLGEKKALSDITPPDSLFLSVCIRSKHEQIGKIGEFFRSIQFDYPTRVSETEITSRLKEKTIDPRTIEFLRSLDTGIYGYKIQPKQITDEDKLVAEEVHKFLDSMNARLMKSTESDGEVDSKKSQKERDELNARTMKAMMNQMEIYFMHFGADENSVGIAFNQESDGTKRLLRLVQDAFDALDNGYLLVVDEIDSSLHTRACELFIGLFITPEFNRNGAQLLATSHNTNLLSHEKIRRDEVWFVEKGRSGQSSVFSAAEFKMRAEKNLEAAYLDDRFGALPSKVNPILLVQSSE